MTREDAMSDEKREAGANGAAPIPFLVFAVFYVGFSLYAKHLGVDMPFYKVSMPVAFLVASATAMFFNPRLSLSEKIDVQKIEAEADDGMLRICLPVKKEEKTSQVEIKVK